VAARIAAGRGPQARRNGGGRPFSVEVEALRGVRKNAGVYTEESSRTGQTARIGDHARGNARAHAKIIGNPGVRVKIQFRK